MTPPEPADPLEFPRRPALLLALAALSGSVLAHPLASFAGEFGLSSLLAPALSVAGLSALLFALWRGGAAPALASLGLGFALLSAPAPAPEVRPGVVRCEAKVTIEGSRRPSGRFSSWVEVGGVEYVLEGLYRRPVLGEEVAILGYLKQPSDFQARRGALGRVSVTRIEARRAGRGLVSLRGAVRRALSQALRRGAPRQHRFLKSVLLGGAEIRQRERATFSTTGTAHLLSISGLHVGILAGLALWVLRVLGWSPRGQRWGVVGLLLLYLLLVGPRAPTLRATVAAVAWLLAPARSDGFNRLACALLVVVAWDPGATRTLGFQLSFGTVAGLMLLGRCWLPRAWWARQFVSGVAAFFASSPLLAARLGQVPWAALWLGPPALAVFTAVVACGLLGAVLAIVHPALGAPALGVADALASLLASTIESCAERFPADRVAPPSPILVAIGLGAIALGAVRREAGRSGAYLLTLGAVLCSSWTLPPPPLGRPPAEVRVLVYGRGAWLEGPGGLLAVGPEPRPRDLEQLRGSVWRGQRFADWEERPLEGGALLYRRGRWRVLWVPRSGAIELSEPVDLVVTRLRGPRQLRGLRALLRPGAPTTALVTCAPQVGSQRPIVVRGARPGE